MTFGVLLHFDIYFNNSQKSALTNALLLSVYPFIYRFCYLPQRVLRIKPGAQVFFCVAVLIIFIKQTAHQLIFHPLAGLTVSI